MPRITALVTRDGYLKVDFTTSTGSKLEVPTGVSPENVGEYLGELYLALDKFWKLVGTELQVSDYATTWRALQYLHGTGRQLNKILFGKKRWEVTRFMKAACPTWEQSSVDGFIPPVFEVQTELPYMLPFEFLPVFDTTKPWDVGNRTEEELRKELPLLASRFLGFSAIVNRVFLQDSPKPGGIIENLPRVSVRLFQHAGLVGAQLERDFFTTTDWIDLRGPWPTQSLDPDSFLSEFAKQVYDGVDASSRNEPIDQIQHFACHCDTEHDRSQLYSLNLAHNAPGLFRESSVQKVTIGALNREFGSFDERDGNELYPFVFVNACGSSRLTPTGVASFPKMFLELEGNRGVVGTETTIPDVYAAAFSKRFYTNLIRGATAGQSLFNARWSLLNGQHRNPLGILYTVYGDVDLSVRRPLPEK